MPAKTKPTQNYINLHEPGFTAYGTGVSSINLAIYCANKTINSLSNLRNIRAEQKTFENSEIYVYQVRGNLT